MPVRPLEGLVVEASRQQWRERPRQGAEVKAQARPAVHALRAEPLLERQERGAHIRRAPRTAADIDERARFLQSERPEAAGRVELEAAADESHTVGQQGGSEGVAPEAAHAAPVESERNAARAIDPRARRGRQTRTAHEAAYAAPERGGASVMPYTASTSCVTVWRAMLNQAPHPKECRQRSKCTPLGLSRKKR